MMLYTKYKNSWPCGFGEKDFFMFSHYMPMADNDAPRAWPISTQWGMVGRNYRGDHSAAKSHAIRMCHMQISAFTHSHAFCFFFYFVST